MPKRLDFDTLPGMTLPGLKNLPVVALAYGCFLIALCLAGLVASCGAAQKPVEAQLKLITAVVDPLQTQAMVSCDAMEGEFLEHFQSAVAEVAIEISRRHCDKLFAKYAVLRATQLAAHEAVEGK